MQELQRRVPLLGGRYRLGTWLGGGGTADVYRALDTRLQRPVAIKVFRSGTDAAGRARFKEEARLLAGLDHPGLVDVHDAGASGNELYVVMRLVEGKTLADLIDLGPMSAEQVRRLGRRLADVLGYVHHNGIVHRDVKPSNVLLSETGEVFLTDFGISRLVHAVGRVTASGIIMGTATYMAPEQVTDNNIGYPVDVYALGLVLLECLTGQAEYAGMNTEAAIARLTRDPEIPPDLPEPLRGLLRAMTAQDPEHRPSAAQCAAILAGRATDLPPIPEQSTAVEAHTIPTGAGDRRGMADAEDRPAAERSRLWWLGAVPAGLLAACLLAMVPSTLQTSEQPGTPPPSLPQLPPTVQPAGTPRLATDLANLERLAAETTVPQARNRLVPDVAAVKTAALRRDRWATESALGTLTRDIAAAQAHGTLDPATAGVLLAAADRVADDIRTLTPLAKPVPPPVVVTVPAHPPEPPRDNGPGDNRQPPADGDKGKGKEEDKSKDGGLLDVLKGDD